MIRSLGAPLQYSKRLARIERRLSHNFEQHRLAYVMRTGAGYQNPARLQQLQCAQINLFVTLRRLIQHLARFGEGWRIQYYHSVLAIQAREEIEHVRLAEMDVC